MKQSDLEVLSVGLKDCVCVPYIGRYAVHLVPRQTRVVVRNVLSSENTAPPMTEQKQLRARTLKRVVLSRNNSERAILLSATTTSLLGKLLRKRTLRKTDFGKPGREALLAGFGI